MQRILAIILVLLAGPAWAGRESRAEKAERVWQMDRLLTIRIHMSGEQWKMMQPARASRLATAMAVVQHPTTRQAIDAAAGIEQHKPAAQGEHRAPGLVGNEYAYVGATVKIDDKTLKNVGVRFKGQWSYTLAGASPRRPLKLNFDYFEEGQDFHGIQAMALGVNALDPSNLRETLGFACFREAGVPAPRTCLALVYLTVDGVYENEMLGLYTAVEEVNKDFLHEHFETAKGLLIRPERTRNLAYFGDDWEEYSRYNIQSEATPFTARRFMDFTRLINHAEDEEFCAGIETMLDTDEFLRFLAVNVLTTNTDSVLVNGHNFYIYIHPTTGRIAFIPWDLHLSFGWNGQTIEEWAGLTIERPFRENNRLLERVMTVGWMRDKYRDYLREFATGCFAPARMHRRIDRLQEVVRKAEEIARAQGKTLPVSMPAGSNRPRAELKPFVTARAQSVLDQLAGLVQGDPIGGRPPKPAIPVAKPAVPVLPVRLPALPTTQPVVVAPTTRPVVAQPVAVAVVAPQPVAVAPKPTTRPVVTPAPVAVAVKPTTQPAVAATTRPAVAQPVAVAVVAPQPVAPKPATRPVVTPAPVAVAVKPTTQPAVAATTRPAVAQPVAVAVVAPPPVAPKPTTRPVVTPAVAVVRPAKVAAPAATPKVRPRVLPPNPLAQLVLNNTDVERDGQLNRDEVNDAAKHLFIVHGWNHRGPVDEASLAAALDDIGRLLDPFPPSTDETARPEDPLRPRPALTWAKAIMQRADVNKTGRATLEQLLAATGRMFDEADSNGDGVLSSKEIGAFMDVLVPRQ